MNSFKQTKQIAREVAFWTLPPGIKAFIKGIYTGSNNTCNSRDFKHITKEMETIFIKNEKFHNIHNGKRCFILASGPSITTQDLKPLSKEICIAVSSFYFHKDINIIRPQYHIEAPTHPPFGKDFLQNMFGAYKTKYSDETIKFLGIRPYKYSYYQFLEENPQFKEKNFYFLNNGYPREIEIDETNYNDPKIWDITKPLISVRTVIYSAIQVAAYMGFKEIYLLGVDHDYLMNLNRKEDVHFYKEKDSFFNDAEYLNSFNTEWWFHQYYLRWKDYRLMNKYLSSQGCKIYNATNGGMLDVFERVNFNDLFHNVSK